MFPLSFFGLYLYLGDLESGSVSKSLGSDSPSEKLADKFGREPSQSYPPEVRDAVNRNRLDCSQGVIVRCG